MQSFTNFNLLLFKRGLSFQLQAYCYSLCYFFAEKSNTKSRPKSITADFGNALIMLWHYSATEPLMYSLLSFPTWSLYKPKIRDKQIQQAQTL